MSEHWQDFEQIVGHPFMERKWLAEALTHRSYVNENPGYGRDNERLEFLGDAILDFVAAEMLFKKYPDAAEGELTQLRSAIVRAESLAMMAAEIELGDYMLLGRGEISTGGRTRLNILADGFEAIIGAVYTDGGDPAVLLFLLPRLEKMLAYILEHDLHRDARSILQERAQAELHVTPAYVVAELDGSEHQREFRLNVVIGDHVIGNGRGSSKRNAAQVAARDALMRLEGMGWNEETLAIARAQVEALASDEQTPSVSR